jgi:aryl-alcohol dehydrogenase-like predicted oxidoreductase
MKTRTIGSLAVSEVGIGCNNFGARLDQDQTTAVVLGALDAGVNFFDTADIYGGLESEIMLGRALGSRRDEAVVATKCGIKYDQSGFDLSPDYVTWAVDQSLTRLGTDYIDLLQVHYPDDATPIGDTMNALQSLVAQGKVREIGCSNFSASQLRAARDAAGSGPVFVSVQSQYSLLYRAPETDGVLDFCEETGTAFLPYYPLANGLLTGKVQPGQPIPEGTRLSLMSPDRAAHWTGDVLMGRVGDLLNHADEIELSMLTLAFSWLLAHEPVASVIAGASNPDQVRANVKAVQELSPEQVALLNVLTA